MDIWGWRFEALFRKNMERMFSRAKESFKRSNYFLHLINSEEH